MAMYSAFGLGGMEIMFDFCLGFGNWNRLCLNVFSFII